MALRQTKQINEREKPISRTKFICLLIFNKCTNSMKMGKCSQQMLLKEVDIHMGGGGGGINLDPHLTP